MKIFLVVRTAKIFYSEELRSSFWGTYFIDRKAAENYISGCKGSNKIIELEIDDPCERTEAP